VSPHAVEIASALPECLSHPKDQRLDRNLYENDFRFIVGDGEYSCPSFIADFLSPRVTELRASDATIADLRIGIEDPNHFFLKMDRLTRMDPDALGNC
jgi:hypothetical protein